MNLSNGKIASWDDFANLAWLFLCWAGFFGWSLLAASRLPGWCNLLVSLMVSLAFLQYISGVIHEAAHRNFVRRSAGLNELLGNVFGAYVLLYSVDAFRREHMRHHWNRVYLNVDDPETFPVRAHTRSEAARGLLRDLCGLSSWGWFWVRGSQEGQRKSGALASRAPIALHFLVFWGALYEISAVNALAFLVAMLTLYPCANRLRVWGQHGDLKSDLPLVDSRIARNVHSPLPERIFIGNRMHMYHLEHHLAPNLTFRECERRARRKFTAGGDVNQSIGSYFRCARIIWGCMKEDQNPRFATRRTA